METTASLSDKGFIRSLYDFKFVSLIASRFIKFLYACSVIMYSIGYAIVFAALLSRGGGAAAFAILLIPVYLLTLIWLRISMEFLIVVFHIAEDVRTIRIRGGALLGLPVDSGRPALEAIPDTHKRAAGWFDAPDEPAKYRYWDGASWTQHYAPKASSSQSV
jgi:Domain of unknown function (DUF4282)/Protein of unknown function (DUF2510)